MNSLKSNSNQQMIDAIASVGPSYKGPRYHAMRTTLYLIFKKRFTCWLTVFVVFGPKQDVISWRLGGKIKKTID